MSTEIIKSEFEIATDEYNEAVSALDKALENELSGKLRHKSLGEGEVISRDGSKITVKFPKTGAEKTFWVPDCFKGGFFRLSDELTSAMERVAAAEDGKKRAEEAEKAKALAAAAAARTAGPRARRSKSGATTVTPTHPTEKAFEDYLVNCGYKVTTPGGADSTVPQYSKAVSQVLEREGLGWHQAEAEISNLISKYDIGGSEEVFGAKGHSTVINALKAFKDFADKISTASTKTE